MKQWFEITNRADDSPAEVKIYGEIGRGWDGSSGVDAGEFIAELDKIPKNKEIRLRVHSPGGSVFDGLAIYNALSARRDKITGVNDGIALSAGSFILMAAKTVEMPKTSRMMIHGAQGFTIGDSKAMQDMADLLERESDGIADIYSRKTGKSRKEMRALMDATTWMDGPEAKALGFADTVTDFDAVKNTFDLSRFRDVPDSLQTKPATNGGATKETPMNKDNIASPENKAEVPTVPAVKLDEIKQPQAAAKSIAIEEFNALQAKFQASEAKRITNELDAICRANTAINREKWLPRALKDETVLDALREMPVTQPGAEPVRGGVQNFGNPALEAHMKAKPGAERAAFAIANYDELRKAKFKFQPQNANTYDAALVTDFLSDGLVTIANNRLSALRAFSTDFGTDRMKPRATVQVTKATVGASTQTNASNFESGDSTTDNIPVSVSQYSQSFHVTNDQLNSGHKLANVAQINAQAFANKLSDIWTAIITTANFGTALTIGTAANFDSAELMPILSAAKNYRSKNLILDGGHLAYLLPRDKDAFKIGEAGAYGFDLISEQNRWTDATTNTAGFVCGPEAVAVASGLPMQLPNGEFLQMNTISLETLGLTVQSCMWFSRAGRVHWASYDVMFGAAAGDTTQGEVLITA